MVVLLVYFVLLSEPFFAKKCHMFLFLYHSTLTISWHYQFELSVGISHLFVPLFVRYRSVSAMSSSNFRGWTRAICMAHL